MLVIFIEQVVPIREHIALFWTTPISCQEQTVQQTNSEALFISALLQEKHSISCLLHAKVCLSIVEQIHADRYEALTCCIWQCLSNYALHSLRRNGSVRPHQVSHCVRAFDEMLRNNLYRFFIRCTSSSNFFIRSLQMSDAFYKNLHFSSIIQSSCMMEIKCSICPWIVSMFASHQYCFCVVKICGHCEHTKHEKSKKCWESVLLLSRLDTY